MMTAAERHNLTARERFNPYRLREQRRSHLHPDAKSLRSRGQKLATIFVGALLSHWPLTASHAAQSRLTPEAQEFLANRLKLRAGMDRISEQEIVASLGGPAKPGTPKNPADAVFLAYLRGVGKCLGKIPVENSPVSCLNKIEDKLDCTPLNVQSCINEHTHVYDMFLEHYIEALSKNITLVQIIVQNAADETRSNPIKFSFQTTQDQWQISTNSYCSEVAQINSLLDGNSIYSFYYSNCIRIETYLRMFAIRAMLYKSYSFNILDNE